METAEPLPLDLGRGDRFLGTGPTVDMGAYEYLNPDDGLGDPEPPAAGAPAPEPSGTPYVAFTYDALGRRIERIVDSGGANVEVTRYYYAEGPGGAGNGQNVILETDADEAPRRSFVHGSQYIDERVLMRLPNGQEYYYLPRELYSVAALTDETGAIVEAATYDTYGKAAVYDSSAQAVEESPVGNPYYFTGRRLDLLPTASSPQPAAKQLYHYRARAYDPGNGRFLQRDPWGMVDAANLYEYVRSAPAIATDPAGLQAVIEGIEVEEECGPWRSGGYRKFLRWEETSSTGWGPWTPVIISGQIQIGIGGGIGIGIGPTISIQIGWSSEKTTVYTAMCTLAKCRRCIKYVRTTNCRVWHATRCRVEKKEIETSCGTKVVHCMSGTFTFGEPPSWAPGKGPESTMHCETFILRDPLVLIDQTRGQRENCRCP